MKFHSQRRFYNPRPEQATVGRYAALLVGLSLLGIVGGIVGGIVAKAQAQPSSAVISTTRQQVLAPQPSPPIAPSAPSAELRFPQGRYLFGQAAEPEQIGSVYIVFTVVPDQTPNQIFGAFYMPRSSFDCFRGRVEGDRLAMTIRNSYEPTTFTHSIALVERQNVVASGGSTVLEVGLEGFNAIDSLSENDARILSICQSETW